VPGAGERGWRARGRESRHARGGGAGCPARAGYPAARATSASVIRGREEDARGGQNRGWGHSAVVDALRPPLRISRDLHQMAWDTTI
jgi:hypothetical protein